MKKNLLICLSAICFQPSAFSQSPDWLWAKAIGGSNAEYTQSIAVDAADFVYTTGYFKGTVDFDPGTGIFNLTASTNYDVYILKQSSAGNFIWAKKIGGTPFTESYCIALDDSGNVYTAGRFVGTVDFDPGAATYNITSVGTFGTNYDAFILKLDSVGNFVWAKTMGGLGSALCYSIAVDASGNVYTTGIFLSTIDFDPGIGTVNLYSPSWDIFILKLNSSGNFVWAKSIGGANYDVGSSIAIDNSGSGAVYTTGRFQGTVDFDPDTGTFNLPGNVGSDDAFILKSDTGGNFIWAVAMSGAGGDAGNSIAVSPSGNRDVYTTGFFSGTVDFDPGAGVFNLTSAQEDIFISRLDSGGNFIWAKALGGAGSDIGNSIALARDGSGNIYTTGHFYQSGDFDPGVATFNLNSGGGSDAFISKIDSIGNFAWAKAIGGIYTDYGMSIAIDDSADAFITGYYTSPTIPFNSGNIINADSTGGSTDIFIAKLDHLVTGIESVDAHDGMSVFPNPFSDEIVISNKYNVQSTKTGEVILYDVMGKEMLWQKTVGEQTIIRTENLTPGFYLLYYATGNKILTRKLIKF